MRNSKLKIKNYRFLFCVLHFAFLISTIYAQSTNQNFPTAITSNEISGRIAARDIGDARLTDYFYTFSGAQGDVFVNVQTSNFNGDLDIFTAGNLKPLVKITVYADDTNRETGRVIYLRQPTKLVLRVEGRSPNDDPATFTVKFAGSFVPAQTVAENAEPETPEVKSETASDVRVNSVGTIIEVKPKPQPVAKAAIAKKEAKPRRKKSEIAREKKVEANETETKDGAERVVVAKENNVENVSEVKSEIETEKQSAPVATENSVPENNVEEAAPKTNTESSTAVSEEISAEKTTEKTEIKSENAAVLTAKITPRKSSRARSRVKKAVKATEPNPLENVRLIILLKDGTSLERAMSEVFKVGVDKGVLTVIGNDGSIKRYPILDVAKMTIE